MSRASNKRMHLTRSAPAKGNRGPSQVILGVIRALEQIA